MSNDKTEEFKEIQRITLFQQVKDIEENRDDALSEEVAEFVHSTWAEWTRHMLRLVKRTPHGFVIPDELMERWQRQAGTHYKELPPEEQESDKRIASMYYDIFQDYYRKKWANIKRKIHKKTN